MMRSTILRTMVAMAMLVALAGCSGDGPNQRNTEPTVFENVGFAGLAVDGDRVVLAMDVTGQDRGIAVAELDADGSWDRQLAHAVRLGHVSPVVPAIAGDATAVAWTLRVRDQSVMQVITREGDGAWSQPVSIPPVSSVPVGFTGLAGLANGALIGARGSVPGDGSSTRVVGIVRTPDHVWSRHTLGSASRPTPFLVGNLRVVAGTQRAVAFFTLPSGRTRIAHNSFRIDSSIWSASWDGRRWGKARVVSGPRPGTAAFRAEATRDGRALVGWIGAAREPTGPRARLRLAWVDGDDVTRLPDAKLGGGIVQGSLALAVSPTGRAVVLAVRIRGKRRDLVAMRVDDERVGPPQVVLDLTQDLNSSGGRISLDAAIDDGGRVSLLWALSTPPQLRDQQTHADRLMATDPDPDGTRGTAIVLDQAETGSGIHSPQIALLKSGQRVVVWYVGRGTESTSDLKALRLP